MTQPYTVIWVMETGPNTMTSFTKGTNDDPGTGKRYQFWASEDTGRVYWDLDDDAAKTWVDANDPIYTDPIPKWHMYTGVRDNATGTSRLYIDGVLVGEKTDITGSIANGEPLEMGRDLNPPQEGYITGGMDDVRIYSRVLSIEEIQVLASYKSPADLNGDDKINFKDYALLAGEGWLEDPQLWPIP